MPVTPPSQRPAWKALAEHQKKIEALHLCALSGVRRQGEGRDLCAESRDDRLRCLEARCNALQAA